MKLTQEQIECINQTLIEKGLKYDDMKLEVLDHIATEIENEMEATKNDFPVVCHQVFENWKSELKFSKGFFSLSSTNPIIVQSKLGNQFRKELLVAVVLSILLVSIFQLVDASQDKLQFLSIMKDLFFYTYCFTVTVGLLMKLFNSKSRVTSTYKYLFDARFTSLIIFLSIVINSSIPHDQTNQNLFVGTITCFFIFLFSIIYLGIKHLQFSRKFSIQ